MAQSRKKLLYDDYVRSLSEKFERRLADIAAEHNFELGNEFEVAVCKLLKSFLPTRYGVCRGFVVNRHGVKRGDDIIIYDQERFPTLRLLDKSDFSQLESVPIEAVYCYIEAKHSINIVRDDLSRCVMAKAISQCIEVKSLCHQRPKVTYLEVDSHLNLAGFADYNVSDGMPTYRNPILTVVLGRHISSNGRRLTDRSEITNAVGHFPIPQTEFAPDLIIAGGNHMIVPVLETSGKETYTNFFLPDSTSAYRLQYREGLTFGHLLANIAYAIDFIKLGQMPWIAMLKDIDQHDNWGL